MAAPEDQLHGMALRTVGAFLGIFGLLFAASGYGILRISTLLFAGIVIAAVGASLWVAGYRIRRFHQRLRP